MQAARNPIRGFLCSVGLDPEIMVRFQFNPTQLSDKRAITYASLGAPGLLMPGRQYTQGGDRTISFNVRIDGSVEGPADAESQILKDEDGGIMPELNKYRAFLYPETPRWIEARGSFVPLYDLAANDPLFKSPPSAVFGFGERVIKCIVTDVSITELLFNQQLAPLRADVSVTLVELMPNDATSQTQEFF